MAAAEPWSYAPATGLLGLLLALITYVLLFPEKAQLIAGWFWRGIATTFRFADRKAVAHRVEGRINSACRSLVKHAVGDVIEGKLRLKWTSVEQAEALARRGEVLVCMRRSRHEEENVAHAVMAYLPKAVVPRARRYVDSTTMRATDLVIARSVLSEDGAGAALDIFFQKHLDPACTDDTLRAKVRQVDEIDLHGWLLRVLLPEYRRLGDALHPSEPSDAYREEAADLATWLGDLAARPPGSKVSSLAYKGHFFRIAVIFVAIRGRIETEGLRPYRTRAKRYLYRDKYDAVYLMARDDNIPAVEELSEDLAQDALIESAHVGEYQLRRDFKARKLDRERAVIAVLHRRRAPGEVLVLPTAQDDESLPSETHEFVSLPPLTDSTAPPAEAA